MTSADCTYPWEQTQGISSRMCHSKPSKHLPGTAQSHKLQAEMQRAKANLFYFSHTAKAAGILWATGDFTATSELFTKFHEAWT